ncbi:MAG: TonB-dependent receptor [Edaphocola sp.]
MYFPQSIFAVLCCTLATLVATAYPVKIKVVDETGDALPGVSVKLLRQGAGENETGTVSDAEGMAVLNIDTWPAALEVTNVGFKPYKVAIKTAPPSGACTISLGRQYTGLNEVVVTGLGRPTKLDEAVSVYRVIGAEKMRAMGAVNLTDALRNELGINMNQDASLGTQINMRGLSGNNIKILLDGLPLNGREGNNIDLSQINLNNVERIETVQGPMNVMYGSDAIGGIINVITKTNIQAKSIGANAYYESVGRYNFGVDGAIVHNRHNLSISGARNFFQGWDPDYDTVRNPLWKPKLQYVGNLKYTYRFQNDASVTWASDYLNELLAIKGSFPDGYSNDNRFVSDAYYRTQRLNNRLQFKWKAGANGYWESNNSYALYHRDRTTRRVDLSTMDYTLSTVSGDQSVNSFNNFTSRTTYNNRAGIFNYTFGYDANLEFAKGVDKIAGGSKHIGDYALFLTTDIKLWQKLTIQPAFRFIHNTAYNAPISPSLSFLYKPDAAWAFRASYSRGFRAPTLKELYLDFVDNNHQIYGNTDLKAEYSQHLQASAGCALFNEKDKTGHLSLTGFYDDVRDQIALAQYADSSSSGTTTVPYHYVNIGRTRILVLQLTSGFAFGNLAFDAGGSYTKSFETVAATDTTPNFHYYEVNGNVRYDIPKWAAGMAMYYKYTGSQPIVGSIEGGSLFSSEHTKGYHNIDISANKYLWGKRLNLTVGLRNLFNNSIIGFVGQSNSGGTSGGHSLGSGLNLTTGRTAFASLRFNLTK